MVHPAPRMTSAPVAKRAEVAKTVEGAVIGEARGAARSVLKIHGKSK